jgi:hypothetical protein
MLIERFYQVADGMGGFLHGWNPSDDVPGVFCQEDVGYKFIYKCSKLISTQDRFRLGNRQFEIKEITPASKSQWQIARLMESHHGA